MLTCSQDKKQKTLNESRPASTESKNHVQELRAEYDAVKKKDDMKKASRTAIFERIRNIDAQIKTRVDQLQRQKSQLSYRTEAEFDGEIARLDGSVGKVTLVQERENAKRVDQLRQQRKALGFLREIEGVIDQLKTKKSQEKALLDDAESRQLKAEMDQIQERIRDAKAQNDDSFGRFTRARDELQQAKDLQNKQYAHIKRLKDEFYNHKRQVQAYEREASKQRELRRRAERERLLQERQAEVLKQRVEEASLPAYSAEIRAAESLIRLVTPLSQSEKAETGPSSLAAQPQRTVDAAGMKGTPLAKKVDEDAYFVGSGSKKGKKGKRDKVGELTSVENATVTRNIGVFYNQGLLEQLNLLDIAPPTTEDDVSRMLGQLKAKRDFFMDDRARKTTEVRVDLLSFFFPLNELSRAFAKNKCLVLSWHVVINRCE